MRATIFFLHILMFLAAKAQVNQLEQILPSEIEGFNPVADFESRMLNDGTVRMSRKLASEERGLTIKLSVSSEENLDKNLADIGSLINTLSEMADEGLMTLEKDQGQFYSGIFTFISRQQDVAGGLFLVRDKYLLEIEIIGGASIEECKAIFDQLDLSKLK